MKFTQDRFYFKSEKKRICYGIFLLLILCGIILGTVMICNSDNPESYNGLLFTHNILKKEVGIAFVTQLVRSFMPFFMILMLQFFSGYFAFGQLLAVLSLIYRGTAFGISASLIYLNLGLKGILIIIITVLPFSFGSSIVLILGAREVFKLSNKIADYSFFGNGKGEYPNSKLYLIKFAVLSAFALLLSAADTLIIYFFSKI